MKIKNQIEEALNKTNPSFIKVTDESDQHAGRKTETHFRVEIEAEIFREMSLLQRHRWINESLKEILPKIHALSLHPYAKGEFQEPPPSPSCSKH